MNLQSRVAVEAEFYLRGATDGCLNALASYGTDTDKLIIDAAPWFISVFWGGYCLKVAGICICTRTRWRS